MVAPALLRVLALLVAGARAKIYAGCAVRRASTQALVNGTVDRLVGAGEVCASGATLPAQLYEMGAMGFVSYGTLGYGPTNSASAKRSVLEGVVDFAGATRPGTASEKASGDGPSPMTVL
jgi:ABC-type phosphate transport system substrate-binding protein